MPLSPNERRKRARDFVKQYRDKALNEKSDSQTFWNSFFDVFGVERKSVAVFESQAKRRGRPGWIDLFWPGTLIVEQKSPGRDLEGALEQAEDYFLSLEEADRPRYLLACDFKNFLLCDLVKNTRRGFKLSDLPAKLGLFGFMSGAEPDATDEEPVSVKASRLMAKIYLRLKKSGYGTEDAGYLLTRLTYCMFADDTGIFEHNTLHRYVENRTAPDGSDLGPKLIELFQVLNTAPERRQSTLDEDLAKFPYIDGTLFEGAISIPAMDSDVRKLLLDASSFDWNGISPAIFGSLFQNVMSAEERRGAGAHYTTEENIMKVIEPLFLDDLRAEFKKIRTHGGARRKAALENFRDKLANLRFLDPACGSGNFLITAYKHLRKLELDAIVDVYDTSTKRFNPASMPKINVDQFYGIELNTFSAKIAETAMWMADHLANNEISEVYGDSYIRIPLEKKANIWNADALETDWNDVLPVAECLYILGNPPFGGSKIASKKHRAQVKRVANLGGSGGTLDYVAAWFVKAVKYAPDAPFGFVATNSITQGEQVGQLWPALLKDGREISFAHRSFKWDSDATGKAAVHVIVVGLAKNIRTKRLFDGEHEENPRYISPYLIGFDKAIRFVSESAKPLNGLSKLRLGSQPLDGGHYIFTSDEKMEFLDKEPGASKFLRPYVGAKEFINGGNRWVLALHDVEPSEIRSMPEILKCIDNVHVYRSTRHSKPTLELAKTPTQWNNVVWPETPFLLIPRVSSEKRKYVPIGYAKPPIIPSDATLVVEGATVGLFGLLTSKMHMVWLAKVGGRLKGDYRYSAGLVYNTFPLPPGDIDVIEIHAQAILDARAAHSDQTLADLYCPKLMPPDLYRAHKRLDMAVDRLYRKELFKDDHERLEFLLERYGSMAQN